MGTDDITGTEAGAKRMPAVETRASGSAGADVDATKVARDDVEVNGAVGDRTS